MQNIKLNDKIKYVKRILRTPYHFFFVPMKSNLVGIKFEDREGQSFTFTGPTMFEAVVTAENYVIDGLKEGSLKEPEPRKKTAETEEKK